MNIDALIVGQGLAGSLIASALEDHGYSFIIYDEMRPHAASRYAAGLINPITGRRFVKAWNYNLLEPIFIETYRKVESKLNERIFFDHQIRLCLSSVKEENDLLSQAMRYGYHHLIQLNQDQIRSENIYCCYDLQAYKVDIIQLIKSFRAYWSDQKILINNSFDYALLKQQDERWEYQGNHYKLIIFCEGVDVRLNPFFDDLPIIPNKGQMIWVKMDELQDDITLKQQLIVSGRHGVKWVGATYEWNFSEFGPTDEGLVELQAKLKHMCNIPFEVLSHHAGLRPTTKDRRPIMKRHPTFNNIWAINGFGTKGASYGPYIAWEFISTLKDSLKE